MAEFLKATRATAPHVLRLPWNKISVSLLALLPLVAHVFAPPSDNQLVTAVVITCLTLGLWSARLVPVGWTSVGALILVTAFGVLPFHTLWPEMVSSPVLVIASGFILAEAVNRSGLADYVSAHIVRSSRTVRTMAVKLALVELASALVIPNVAVRVALLIPVLRRLPGLSTATRALLIIDASVTSVLTGSLTLTSSSSAISSQEILGHIFGETISFWQWMNIFDPVVLGLWLVAQSLIIARIPVRCPLALPVGAAPVLPPVGRRVLIYLALILFGWVIGPTMGLSLGWSSVIGAMFFLLPRMGVLHFKDGLRALRWDLLLFYVTSLSFPAILTRSGAATFLTRLAVHVWHPPQAALFFAGFALCVVALRLVFSNSVTLTAILLPIIAKLAPVWHLDSHILSYILIFAGSFGFLLPAQSPAGMMAADGGQLTTRQFVRIGIWIALAGTLLVSFAALYYWPSRGFS